MLIIGSRGSKLALWQANHIKDRLEVLGEPSRIEVITTTGDAVQHVALKEIGNKGLFTKEIEEALLDGRIDLAVHSLKDMPTTLPEGLEISATPVRADPRDALLGARLEALPAGARIGTGSLRRIAILNHLRPDVVVEPMRGNVDTRIRKLDDGHYDAIVLAAAGLTRLGWEHRISQYLDIQTMCPAVAQGALAIQTRIGDPRVRAVCTALDDPDTRAAITAERAVLEHLGGGCQVPVGVHAFISGSTLHLQSIVLTPRGERAIKRQTSGAPGDAAPLGHGLAAELLSAGAGEILRAVYG